MEDAQLRTLRGIHPLAHKLPIPHESITLDANGSDNEPGDRRAAHLGNLPGEHEFLIELMLAAMPSTGELLLSVRQLFDRDIAKLDRITMTGKSEESAGSILAGMWTSPHVLGDL